jgi:uncharacterized membrane protein
MNTARALAAVLYVVIDIIYVRSSFPTYNAAAKAIQSAPMDTSKAFVLPFAALAYASMAVGWALLVAPQVEQRRTWSSAVVYGGVYAFLVYATFNASNFALFKNWGVAIALRDLAWGVTSVTLFTLAYVAFLRLSK